MTKLSDTQLVILTAACQREDRLVLPLPDRLKGGAAAKVLDSLKKKGLIEEVGANQAGHVETELGNRAGNLCNLLVTMGSRIRGIGQQLLDRPLLDLQTFKRHL